VDGVGRESGDMESRAAYLSGLVQGLGLRTGRPEGRVLEQVVELLEDVVRELDAVRKARATPPRRGGAEGADRPLFLACECPHCGQDIFAEVGPAVVRGREEAGAGALRDRQETGSAVQEGGPAALYRDFILTCTNCGETIHVAPALPSTPPPEDGTASPGRVSAFPRRGARRGGGRRPQQGPVH